MAMAVIWTGMVAASILCGLATGNGPAVAAAAMEGAAAAVELCLSMAGVICLWNGVMAVMKACGLTEGLVCDLIAYFVAVLYGDDSFGHLCQLVVVGDENYGGSLVVELYQLAHDVGARLGVQITRRLVGHYYGWLCGDGSRYGDALLLAARKFAGPVIYSGLKANFAQGVI